MKNRVFELDFVRVVAMFSVIAIHVSSTYIYSGSNMHLLGMNLAFILNQVTRFAVPLFVLLSGISIGLGTTGTNVPEFYKNRFIKIGIPYVIWSILYILYNNHADLGAIDLQTILRTILLGQAAPHLYFVVIIFQLYLLVPLLKKFATLYPIKSVLISFIISYGIQEEFYFLKYDLNLIPNIIRPYLWLLFPTWIFYFVFGLVIANDNFLMLIQKVASKNAITIIVVTLVYAFFYVVESNVTNSLDSIKTSLNIYVPLVLLFSFSVWSYLKHIFVVQRIILFLSKHSSTIYFEHVLTLYFFRRFAFFSRGMSGMILLFIIVALTSCLVAIPIDAFFKLFRKSNR